MSWHLLKMGTWDPCSGSQPSGCSSPKAADVLAFFNSDSDKSLQMQVWALF